MALGRVIVRIEGNRRFRQELRTTKTELRSSRDRGLVAAGKKLEREVRRTMRPGAGTFQEPTGAMAQTVNTVLYNRGQDSAFVLVGPYGGKGNLARIHEEGLRVSNPARKYRALGFFKAAVDKLEDEIFRTIGRSIRLFGGGVRLN